jgi:hypothetical protein
VFIQGPSEFDDDILRKRQYIDKDIDSRRLEEEGEGGTLGSNEWAIYHHIDELEDFIAWLNPKGHRELALKTAITKWWVHITAGMRRRLIDVTATDKLSDARRRSRRHPSGYDLSKDPYMLWTNRRAANSS